MSEQRSKWMVPCVSLEVISMEGVGHQDRRELGHMALGRKELFQGISVLISKR